MRIVFFLCCMMGIVSCNNVVTKLSVPAVFKEQATELHIKGAKKNKIEFGSFTSSKIKRGMHMSYPGWSRGFLLENLLLNQLGIQKNERVKKEKANFRFSISDGKNQAQVFGKETELTRSLEYKIMDSKSIFSKYERLQEYRYVFSALISADTLSGKTWELLMTNIYERKNDTENKLFTIVRPDDNGLATNGTDTLYIKAVMLKDTEGPNGKKGKFPIKMLGGYELSTSDGVVAIIDIVGSNLWFYNELEAAEKLPIAAIATAIFARRVNDIVW